MMLFYILQVLLGFGFIIFIHEMGHFLAAKWVGIRVHAFSIGFPLPFVGKRFSNIFAKKIGDTEYRLGWVPFGGYVQMEGQSDTPGKLGDAIKNDPGDYRNKSYWQKTLVLLGGVTMNAITAVIFFVIAFQVGVTFIDPVVGQVQPQSGAWLSNEIKVGDRITHVNGRAIDDFEDVVYTGVFEGGEAIDLTIVRKEGKKEVTKEIKIKLDEDATFGLLLPGIRAKHRVLLAGEEAARFSESLGEDRPVDGDEIIGVNGRDIRNYEDFLGLLSVSRGEISLKFRRGTGDNAREWSAKHTPSRHFTSGSSSNVMGMYISELAPVRIVRDGTSGQRAGLKAGDKIVAWKTASGEERAFSSFGEFQDWLNGTKGQPSPVVIVRDGKRETLTLVADEKDNVPGRFELGVIMGDPAKVPETDVKIMGVREGSVAHKAGLLAGDKVVGASVNGESFYNPSSGFFSRLFGKSDQSFGVPAFGLALAAVYDVETRKASDLIVTIERKGKTQDVTLTPDLNGQESVASMLVSVAEQRSEPKTKDMGDSIVAGFHHSRKVGYKIGMTLLGLVSGRISITHLGGPLVIAKRSYSLANWGLGTLIFFLAFISLNLAIVNVIPIPILDGGQWLLVTIEALAGKPVPDKLLNPIMTVSFFLVVGLMLFVLGNDFVTVFVKKWV